MSQLDASLAHSDARFDSPLARLFEVMGLKSRSTDPADNAERHARDLASDAFRITGKAMTAEWGCPTVLTGGGGSSPEATSIKEKLGFDEVLTGFGLCDENVHSLNEKYALRCFHKGIRSWARILAAI